MYDDNDVDADDDDDDVIVYEKTFYNFESNKWGFGILNLNSTGTTTKAFILWIKFIISPISRLLGTISITRDNNLGRVESVSYVKVDYKTYRKKNKVMIGCH